MAHGSKMISRVLEEADRAIATARYFAPDVAAAWGALRPRVEGNLAPDISVYLETVIERIEVLRERLSSAHLHRCTLRSRTHFQHDAVRSKADRVRYLQRPNKRLAALRRGGIVQAALADRSARR